MPSFTEERNANFLLPRFPFTLDLIPVQSQATYSKKMTDIQHYQHVKVNLTLLKSPDIRNHLGGYVCYLPYFKFSNPLI